MTLVPEWRKAWRWFSVQGLAVLALLPIVYENADFLQNVLSESHFRRTMAVLGALALIGRLVKQR